MLIICLEAILIIAPLLITIALFTLAERKVMASIQRRRGPNITGFWGLLQPFADGLKLILKEIRLPITANFIFFISAPALAFFLSLMGWAVIPFDQESVFADVECSILYLLVISSFNSYSLLLSGWASNSKYSIYGTLRGVAQLVTYELILGLAILCVMLCASSPNLLTIVAAQQKIWFIVPLFPIFIIFFIAGLAETNRIPFDLPEAEAELVAGYNTEYSGILFALFFLAEYGNILLFSTLSALIFFGGWSIPFTYVTASLSLALKVIFFCYLFILVRAALPRYRSDQLLLFGWSSLLPFATIYIVIVCLFLN